MANELSLLGAGNTGSGGLPVTSGLIFWLDASQLTLSDGNPITSWTDKSGAGLHFTGAGGARPTYKTNIVNGKAVARFNSASLQCLANASWNTGLTQGEMYIVLKMNVYPPALNSDGGLVTFGSEVNSAGFFNDGKAYDNFGSTSRHDGIVLGVDMASAFRLYNPASISAAWSARMNGSVIQAPVAGTVGWASTVKIGCDPAGNFWLGDIAEIVFYSPVLSAGNRSLVQAYLSTKYSLGF